MKFYFSKPSIIFNFPTCDEPLTKLDISRPEEEERTERKKTNHPKGIVVSRFRKKSLVQTRENRETVANSRNNRGTNFYNPSKFLAEIPRREKASALCLLQPLARWYLKRGTASFSSEIPFAENLGKNLCRGAENAVFSLFLSSFLFSNLREKSRRAFFRTPKRGSIWSALTRRDRPGANRSVDDWN